MSANLTLIFLLTNIHEKEFTKAHQKMWLQSEATQSERRQKSDMIELNTIESSYRS